MTKDSQCNAQQRVILNTGIIIYWFYVLWAEEASRVVTCCSNRWFPFVAVRFLPNMQRVTYLLRIVRCYLPNNFCRFCGGGRTSADAGLPSTMKDWRFWHWRAKSAGKLASWLCDTSMTRRLLQRLNFGNSHNLLHETLSTSRHVMKPIEEGSSRIRLFDKFRNLFWSMANRWSRS